MRTFIETKERMRDGAILTFECEPVAYEPNRTICLFRSTGSFATTTFTMQKGGLSYGFFWRHRPYILYRISEPDGSLIGHRFDVVDRHLAVIGRERTRHRRGRIALDDDAIGRDRVHHPAEPGQQPRGECVERLIGLHHVEIVLGYDPGDLQHLVQHLAVLRRNADLDAEPIVRLERGDDRKQLDGFRTRPGDEGGESALASWAAFATLQRGGLSENFPIAAPRYHAVCGKSLKRQKNCFAGTSLACHRRWLARWLVRLFALRRRPGRWGPCCRR